MPRDNHGHHGSHMPHRRHYGHHSRYVFRSPHTRVYAAYAAYPSYYAYNSYYSPVRTAYGSCDCNLNGAVTNNNCTQGVPVCGGGNCTCFNLASQTTGCFNQRGDVC